MLLFKPCLHAFKCNSVISWAKMSKKFYRLQHRQKTFIICCSYTYHQLIEKFWQASLYSISRLSRICAFSLLHRYTLTYKHRDTKSKENHLIMVSFFHWKCCYCFCLLIAIYCFFYLKKKMWSTEHGEEWKICCQKYLDLKYLSFEFYRRIIHKIKYKRNFQNIFSILMHTTAVRISVIHTII